MFTIVNCIPLFFCIEWVYPQGLVLVFVDLYAINPSHLKYTEMSISLIFRILYKDKLAVLDQSNHRLKLNIIIYFWCPIHWFQKEKWLKLHDRVHGLTKIISYQNQLALQGDTLSPGKNNY